MAILIVDEVSAAIQQLSDTDRAKVREVLYHNQTSSVDYLSPGATYEIWSPQIEGALTPEAKEWLERASKPHFVDLSPVSGQANSDKNNGE